MTCEPDLKLTPPRHITGGRHHGLFFGSEPDALVACTWLSLVASAKLYVFNPEDYLRDLFRVLPSWPSKRVLELAPKHWTTTRAQLDAAQLAHPLGPIMIPMRRNAGVEAAE